MLAESAGTLIRPSCARAPRVLWIAGCWLYGMYGFFAIDPHFPHRGSIFGGKERKAMRGKTIVCVMGSLGLLLGAGAAWGNQQMDTTGSGSDTSSAPSSSGSAASSQVAGKPECRDAGVTIAFKTGSAELDQNARGALDGVAHG